MKTTIIELAKDYMQFSAGHYTIFSPTHREKLHGHNFNVYAAITATIQDHGMAFDYDIYKRKIHALCRSLSETFLIANCSPYQRIVIEEEMLWVHFHDERIPFLKKDVTLLPLANITVEELARWFIEQLIIEPDFQNYAIEKIFIKVYSSPGQAGSAEWQRATPSC